MLYQKWTRQAETVALELGQYIRDFPEYKNVLDRLSGRIASALCVDPKRFYDVIDKTAKGE